MKTPEKSGVFSYDIGLFQAHIPVRPEREAILGCTFSPEQFDQLATQSKWEYQFINFLLSNENPHDQFSE